MKENTSLSPDERAQRVAILCCSCIRNIAFYRAGWDKRTFSNQRVFWIDVNSNFIDIAVLEWCKIFADKKGRHNWRKIVSDYESFEIELYECARMSEEEFDAYVRTMLRYRDRFVAHLDDEKTMHIPQLEPAIRSTAYLYKWIISSQKERPWLELAPKNIHKFYGGMFKKALVEYRRAMVEKRPQHELPNYKWPKS